MSGPGAATCVSAVTKVFVTVNTITEGLCLANGVNEFLQCSKTSDQFSSTQNNSGKSHSQSSKSGNGSGGSGSGSGAGICPSKNNNCNKKN